MADTNKKFTELDANTLFASHGNAIYMAVFPHVQDGSPMIVNFADMKAAVLSYPSPSLSAFFARLGYQAGNAVTGAAVNVTAIGGQAGLGNTSGSRNTYLGAGAGTTNVTGDDNTVVGAGANVSGAAQNNSIVIGAGAVGLGSNTTVFGNSSTTRAKLFGTVEGTLYTVATLPAAATCQGARSAVTDANAAMSGNFGAVVAAGGANCVPVFSDGADWRIG